MTHGIGMVTDDGFDRVHEPRSTLRRFDRLAALAGVVGPVLFVAVFTVAGLLRPGYSALRDPVSDLGTGSRAWIQNANFFLFGSLIVMFAAGFYRSMWELLRPRRLKAAVALLVLSGAGIVAAGIFPEDPNNPTAPTGVIHWVVGFLVAFLSAIVAISIVGKQLRRTEGWRAFGRYSTATAWAALGLIPAQFLLLSPSSPLAVADLGGLLERVFAVVVFAWYAVAGWRILTVRKHPHANAARVRVGSATGVNPPLPRSQ